MQRNLGFGSDRCWHLADGAVYWVKGWITCFYSPDELKEVTKLPVLD